MEALKRFASNFVVAIFIGVAALVLLIWAVFILAPEMSTAINMIDGLKLEVIMLEGEAQRNAGMASELAAAREKLAGYNVKFPPEIIQHETLETFHRFEQQTGLSATKLEYTEVQVDETVAPAPTPEPSLATKQQAGTQAEVDRIEGKSPASTPAASGTAPVQNSGMKMTISTAFEGSYDQMVSFMKTVMDYEQKIGLQEVKLRLDKDNIITGSCTLQFYGFMPDEVPVETTESGDGEGSV